MKCKECEANGASYKLHWGGVYPSTLMAFYPFIDDAGERHYHDGNHGGGEYWKCTNGHTVNPDPVATCKCGWPVSGPFVNKSLSDS